jgi:hypothetical protein
MLAKHSLERYGVTITLRFSTVDEYLKAMTETNTVYPVFQGDFFPYL